VFTSRSSSRAALPGCASSPVMGRAGLVTGASSGLGEEFARLFARDGVDLILVARRRERLEALAAELRAGGKVSVQVIAADLGVPGDVDRVIREIQALGTEVEFLVNNAGLFSAELGMLASAASLERVLATNVVGNFIVTREALKMIRRPALAE